MGLLDMDRQAELAQMAKDAERSSHGLLNDSMIPTSLYGSLMQDPADKERMDRQMLESTLAMMPTAGITLKHGSPADFWEFLDKYKLTGEGANAYTSGHYLAEAHKVAMEYVRKLANSPSGNWNFTKKVKDKFQPQIDKVDKALSPVEKEYQAAFKKDEIIWRRGGSGDDFRGSKTKELSRKRNKMLEHREYLENQMKLEGGTPKDASGYLYTAKVKDDVYGKMLDWDKPLTQQKGLLDKIDPEGLIMKDFRGQFGHSNFHEGVKGAKGEKYIDDFFGNMKGRDLVSYLKGTPTWTHLIKNPHNRGSMHDVEGYLKSRGVPGIKYLDQESRPRYLHSLRKDVTPKKQTRNVVSYEPKDIEIIKRQKFDSVLGLLD